MATRVIAKRLPMRKSRIKGTKLVQNKMQLTMLEYQVSKLKVKEIQVQSEAPKRLAVLNQG